MTHKPMRPFEARLAMLRAAKSPGCGCGHAHGPTHAHEPQSAQSALNEASAVSASSAPPAGAKQEAA